MFIHPGLPNAEKVSKLAPGEFGAVFLWVTFDKLEDIPADDCRAHQRENWRLPGGAFDRDAADDRG